MAIATIDYRSGGARVHEASGKLSSKSRRKGEIKDPRDFPRGFDGIWEPVLYHESDGRIGAHLSTESVGRDRGQTGQGVQPERREAEIFEAYQLLWADGGNRRAGEAVDSGRVTGRGADQVRRGRFGRAGLSGSNESHASAGRDEERALYQRRCQGFGRFGDLGRAYRTTSE